jgi:hypothetical protein
MTVHTTTRAVKMLMRRGSASVFAAAAGSAATTDAGVAAQAVTVTIESGPYASSTTGLERGRTTFVVRNAVRA